MTVTRDTYTSASSAFSGGQLADDLAAKSDLWFNNMSLIPTTITNSGNDYTITVSPSLKTGTDVVAGMGFYITPNADNTGPVRLRITSSGSYYNLVKSDGDELVSGEFVQNTCFHVIFVSGTFKILNSVASGSTSGLLNEQTFNTSGTWTKPSNIPTSALVEVWLWGGGGGGGGNQKGGGGGGACNLHTFKITDLPSTVTVTIGAGGTSGNAGGTSTFGSLMSAYGGGSGDTANIMSGGGGGGGLLSVGTAGGYQTGGNGGTGGGGGNNGTANGGTAGTGGCGGGGAGCTTNSTGNGGTSVFGGGGGASAYLTYGGTGGESTYGGAGGSTGGAPVAKSIFGGNGASTSIAATSPGGGGAGSSNSTYNTGAQGKCVVKVIL